MNDLVVWVLITAAYVVLAGVFIARGVTLLLGMAELDAWIKGEKGIDV